jgi:hypothetical protein
MKFLFGENNLDDNFAHQNVNARWGKPSAIHDNACTLGSYGDAKHGNKEGWFYRI